MIEKLDLPGRGFQSTDFEGENPQPLDLLVKPEQKSDPEILAEVEDTTEMFETILDGQERAVFGMSVDFGNTTLRLDGREREFPVLATLCQAIAKDLSHDKEYSLRLQLTRAGGYVNYLDEWHTDGTLEYIVTNKAPTQYLLGEHLVNSSGSYVGGEPDAHAIWQPPKNTLVKNYPATVHRRPPDAINDPTRYSLRAIF